MERLLTRQEAAELLSVPVSKIDALVRTKQVPYLKLPAAPVNGQDRPARYVRFRKEELESWLETLMGSSQEAS